MHILYATQVTRLIICNCSIMQLQCAAVLFIKV